jgi:putative hemolysin
MRQIGSIPKVGDTFVWNKLKIKIVKMDGRRVEKVLINLVPPQGKS